MVEKEEFRGEVTYYCDCCGLHYRDREKAEECEEHCKIENKCQHSVTKEAIERGG